MDAATLTGACVVALGNDIAGLFSNDEELAVSLMMAGDTAMDPVWRMPLDISFTKALKSNFADLANISDSRGRRCLHRRCLLGRIWSVIHRGLTWTSQVLLIRAEKKKGQPAVRFPF